MIFYGWQKESLIEWPGKICSVIFTGGCNFRCPFCHNSDLISFSPQLPKIDEKEILDYCSDNKDFLDALAITGGEPLLSKKEDLVNFLKKVHKIGLLIEIETNGSNPDMITYLLENKLVDYLAMDIKAPLNEKKYSEVAGVKVDLNNIKKSINIIIQSHIDYEFRTTVVPTLLSDNDILEISRQLKGATKYYLQQFNPENSFNPEFRKVKPYPREWFEDISKKILKINKNLELRVD